MVKVKVWRTGRKPKSRGSLAIVIPYQLAEALEINEGMTLECKVDVIDGEICYRKVESWPKGSFTLKQMLNT